MMKIVNISLSRSLISSDAKVKNKMMEITITEITSNTPFNL